MGTSAFGSAYIDEVRETPNKAGGNTLTLYPAFATDKVQWNDAKNVIIAASKALAMADDFHDLVQENCNFEDPIISNRSIEIYIAIAAFACELYLKSLIYLDGRHGGKEIRCHDLCKLIDSLPSEIRKSLYALNQSFENGLAPLAESFTEMRYAFEFNAFNKEYLLIFDLMNALQSISESCERTSLPTLRYSGAKVVVE